MRRSNPVGGGVRPDAFVLASGTFGPRFVCPDACSRAPVCGRRVAKVLPRRLAERPRSPRRSPGTTRRSRLGSHVRTPSRSRVTTRVRPGSHHALPTWRGEQRSPSSRPSPSPRRRWTRRDRRTRPGTARPARVHAEPVTNPPSRSARSTPLFCRVIGEHRAVDVMSSFDWPVRDGRAQNDDLAPLTFS